jgi:protein-S-isoprenylcysteine O-methyltransferase Ste14
MANGQWLLSGIHHAGKSADVKRITRFDAPAWLIRYRVRITAVLLCLLFTADVVAGVHPHAFTDPWGMTGLGLMLAGLALRSWSAGIITKDSALATAGPYALIRHPLYAGSLLMAVGLGELIGGYANTVVLAVAAIALYAPKLRDEEAGLAARFGSDWRSYHRLTPMLIPGRRSTLRTARWSLQQWRRNEEHWTVIGAAAVVALLTWMAAA